MVIYSLYLVTIRPSWKECRRKSENTSKSLNLGLTFKYDTKVVNFLDTTLNLNSGLYYPYSNLDEITKYVSISSNHPSNVIKSLVTEISKEHYAIID